MFGNRPPARRSKGRFLFFIPVAIAIGAAVGGVVMLLWNNLMPELFGLKRITFWQAFGLLALCRILFGGFRGYGGWRRGWHGHRFGHRRCGPDWHAMTPEEREQFRRGIRPDHRPDNRSRHQHPDARTGVPE
jgi:hypothetical protein